LNPVLFNVFLNDIFNFVKENKLYNYADDNTLSHSAPDLNGLVKSLELPEDPSGVQGQSPIGGFEGESPHKRF
jgi:hypothetical protein